MGCSWEPPHGESSAFADCVKFERSAALRVAGYHPLVIRNLAAPWQERGVSSFLGRRPQEGALSVVRTIPRQRPAAIRPGTIVKQQQRIFHQVEISCGAIL
jgi:hypothetical protein